MSERYPELVGSDYEESDMRCGILMTAEELEEEMDASVTIPTPLP